MRPGPAAQDVRVLRSEVRTAVPGNLAIVHRSRVIAVLPDVPVHLEEPEPVGRVRPYRRRRATEDADRTGGIGTALVRDAVVRRSRDVHTLVRSAHGAAGAAVVRQLGREGWTEMEGGGGERAARVFPFGFAGQPDAQARQQRQAPAELGRLIPADRLDREVVAAEGGGVRRKGLRDRLGCGVDQRRPLGLGHCRAADPDLLYLHDLLRPLVRTALQFVVGRPDAETSGGDHGERQDEVAEWHVEDLD